MKKAINVMICIMIPITIITCLCSQEIVSIAYKRGNFTDKSVMMTSAALIGYALGFTSMGVRDIVLRGLYAFKNTRGPMITGFFAVGANILCSVILSRYIGVMGIAIGSSVSLTVNFLINSQMLKKHIPQYRFVEHIPTLLKQLPGAAYTVLVVLLMKHLFTSNILTFVTSAALGLAGYAVILMAMHVEEVDYLRDKVVSKISNRK